MSDATTAAPIEEGDEAPDYVRLTVLLSILLVLLGIFVYKRFINPPKKPYYTDLPGINLTVLDPKVRDQVLVTANATECGCGLPNCTYNVAECRHMDPGCDNSLRRAAEIVKTVSGKEAVRTTDAAANAAATPASASPSPAAPSQGLGKGRSE